MSDPCRPLLDTAGELSFPRFPGTEAERRAGDAIERAFRDLGLRAERETFRACRSAVFRFRLLVHGAAASFCFGAGLLAAYVPTWGAALGVAVLVLLLRAGSWPRSLERGFDREPSIESANVVARRPGRGGKARTVVFLAHYDSKSALFPTFFPVLLILLGAGCSLALAALSVTALVSDSRPLDAIASILLGSAGAVAFLVAAINPHGNESPGAMDNASGISVLLALARALPAERSLDATELVFLATGAEEIGLCGALRWIQRHAAELDPSSTVFVNIDSVGVGNGLLFLDVRGHGPDGRAMKDLVREAAARERVAARRVRFLPGVGVDSMPIGSRGFATVTILGKVLGSAARRIHTRRDTLEHLREDALQNAFSFARALARELGTRGGD